MRKLSRLYNVTDFSDRIQESVIGNLHKSMGKRRSAGAIILVQVKGAGP